MTLMGILNVTPDSFSDGGKCLRLEDALRTAEQMEAEGATLLDIGGESTRPGARDVSAEEQIERVLPVIEALKRRTSLALSIDTRSAWVARAALEAGASIVNDVSAGGDPEMADVVLRHRATWILMHMQGTPQTMQLNPVYPQGVEIEVRDFLAQCRNFALSKGISQDKIWLDPGIGFGKTAAHNWRLLARLRILQHLGCPIVLGVSRKGFLGKVLTPELPPEDREEATIATCLWGYTQGAQIFRVHRVAGLRQALAAWQAAERG